MFITSTALSVVFDPAQPFYTHDDIIQGFIVAYNKKPRSALSVNVSLKCTETAAIQVKTEKGTREEIANRNWLEIHQCVFPTSEMKAVTPGKHGYTLQTGEHKFAFAFRLPPPSSHLPPTCPVGTKSGVYWSLHAVLEAPSLVVSRTKWAHTLFEFQSSAPQPPIANYPQSDSLAKRVTVHLPGFAQQQQSFSAKLRNLVHSSPLSTQTCIGLTLFLNQTPLQQGIDTPLGADLQLNLSDPGLAQYLCITKLEVTLKQRIILQFGHWQNPHRDVRYFDSVLLRQNGIRWNLDQGEQRARETLTQTCIPVRLPPTRSGALVNVEYDFILTVVIASEETPTHGHKLQLSMPVVLAPYPGRCGAA